MVARPALLSPTAGAYTEASATEFHWQSDPSLASTLEVAKSSAFETILLSVPVQGLQTLQFQHLLPTQFAGEPLFWRVGVTKGAETAWSAAARFVPARDKDYASWKQQQDAKVVRAQRMQRKAAAKAYDHSEGDVAVAPPIASGFTSKREMLLFLYIMLVSFLATVALLYKVVM